MTTSIDIDVKEDDPNIKYDKQHVLTDQERYELCGYRTLVDLKNYGKLVGKDYTGDSFEDGYKFIFGKDLNRHVALRKYRRKVRERLLKVSNFELIQIKPVQVGYSLIMRKKMSIIAES